jgi:hypothetical protein
MSPPQTDSPFAATAPQSIELVHQDDKRIQGALRACAKTVEKFIAADRKEDIGRVISFGKAFAAVNTCYALFMGEAACDTAQNSKGEGEKLSLFVVQGRDGDDEAASLVAKARGGQTGIKVETSRLVVRAG